jgi:hypothetical protein
VEAGITTGGSSFKQVRGSNRWMQVLQVIINVDVINNVDVITICLKGGIAIKYYEQEKFGRFF